MAASSNMNLGKVVAKLKDIFPLQLAEKWDNVGLLVEPSIGSSHEIKKIILTNDLTEDVMDEALNLKVNMIFSYHPPIFAPLKQLTTRTDKQRIIVKAIENKIAIFSPHTACDAVEGGVNDWIAKGIMSLSSSSSSCSPAQPSEEIDSKATHKIVVFSPSSHTTKLREAMSEAGAGQIGNYTNCSFTLHGTGSFLGNSSSNPVVGQKGVLENAEEDRLEMVVGKQQLPSVLSAICKVHPYETPAYDVYTLPTLPSTTRGMGRIIKLGTPVSLADIISRVKTLFNIPFVKVATPRHKSPADIKVTTIASCAGAGQTVISHVAADLYLTGELRHHEILEATAKGVSVIICDHSNTERGYLSAVLLGQLSKELPGVDIIVSTVDRDPLSVV